MVDDTILAHSLSSQAESFTSSKSPANSAMDVFIHGLASHAGIAACCVFSEIRSQVNYKTNNDEQATISFHRVAGGKLDSQDIVFPWQKEVFVDEGRAFSRIISGMSMERARGVLGHDISLRILYNLAMLTPTVRDSHLGQRLSWGLQMLKVLEQRSILEGALQQESQLLEMELSGMETVDEDVNDRLQALLDAKLPEYARNEYLKVLVDTCPILECGQPLRLGGSDDAVCYSGHALAARCGITFLPLSDPNEIKYCLDCMKPFANEATYLSTDLENAGMDLRNMLLQTLVNCPYCGGNFFTRHHEVE